MLVRDIILYRINESQKKTQTILSQVNTKLTHIAFKLPPHVLSFSVTSTRRPLYSIQTGNIAFHGDFCIMTTPFNRVIQIAPVLLGPWVRSDSEVKNVRLLSIRVFHENTLLSNVHTFLSLFWESIQSQVQCKTKWDWMIKINL